MRLTCPNCDAQYEVPDEVVPVTGRDVQCSNCGQTWFQHHPDHASDEDDESGIELDAPALDDEVSPPPPPPVREEEPQRRQLDPAVADILRQEAEAEHEARRKRQSEVLESQPDLGLDNTDWDDDALDDEDEENEAARRSREARQRMARMRGQPVPDAAVTGAAITSRRGLLPDIEEINSTLRKDGDRGGANHNVHGAVDAAPKARGRQGFRNGFLFVLCLMALLAALYVYAPQIAKAVPQVDPYLSGYVGWVDQTRLWLDGQVQSLLQWLDSIASQSDG